MPLSSFEVLFGSFKISLSFFPSFELITFLSDSDVVSVKSALCTTDLCCKHALRHSWTLSMNVLLPLEVPSHKKSKKQSIVKATTASTVVSAHITTLLLPDIHISVALALSTSSATAVATKQLQSERVPVPPLIMPEVANSALTSLTRQPRAKDASYARLSLLEPYSSSAIDSYSPGRRM